MNLTSFTYIKISPLYQSIRDFGSNSVSLSAEDSPYFEPLLLESLTHFSKLMDAYQGEKGDNTQKVCID